MIRLLITTPYHLSQICKKELAYHGYHGRVLSPSIIYVQADIQAIAHINVRSRVANKVYLILNQGIANDFQSYFEIVHDIDRWKYVQSGQTIVTGADTYHSILHHNPSIQSVSKKAIVKKLTGDDHKHRYEDSQTWSLEVHTFVLQNQAYVCLNTSGQALYKRWYRNQTGDAPIKENIAAALVLMSNRTYHKPLWDLCCGSGTICIEAAMIAKSMAPWLLRSFAFEHRERYDKDFLSSVREQVHDHKISKEHTIIGVDSDPEVLLKARANMEILGLGNSIVWKQDQCQSYQNSDMNGTLISNPPYGHRLNSKNIDQIHHVLSQLYISNPDLGGGCISWYSDASKYFVPSIFRQTILYNGPQEVVRYHKKPHLS
jgi:putative N6-adenine-specific DNA methylase